MVNKEKVKFLKEKYKKGTEIELINMNDSMAVPNGTKGVVEFVDDIGTIHMNWDNGSTLGLIFGEDNFKIISEANPKFENLKVSEEEFASYLKLQKSGIINMHDSVKGCEYSGLDKKTYLAIIENYSSLIEQYPETYENVFNRNINI